MQAITPEALEVLLRNDEVIVLDIRDETEFNSERIPGALLLPSAQIDEALEKTLAGKLAVFYCSSGVRTKNAAPSIDASGLSSTKYLQGGLNAWSQQGLPTAGGGDRKLPLSVSRQVQISIAILLLFFGGLSLTGIVWPVYLVVGIGLGLLFAGITGNCAMASLIMLMPWNQRF